MALPKEYTREAPAFTLVSEYSVGRIGQFPTLRVSYDEVVYLQEDEAPVLLALDTDTEGKFECLHVPAWADRTDVVGRLICLEDSTVVGTVGAATRVDAVSPDVPYLEITLVVGCDRDITGEMVGLVERTPVGTLAYRRAKGGVKWQTLLNGGDTASMTRMAQMLGGTYFAAMKAGLQTLNITGISDAQILGAVQTLAAAGVNIDGLLAMQGEQLEVARRLGNVPEAVVFGDAP